MAFIFGTSFDYFVFYLGYSNWRIRRFKLGKWNLAFCFNDNFFNTHGSRSLSIQNFYIRFEASCKGKIVKISFYLSECYESFSSKIQLIHAICLTGAFLIAAFGLFAIFSFHDAKMIPNMYTLHSWLGLAFTIIFGVQLVGGLFSFLFPLVPPQTRTAFLPYHRTFGIIVLAALGLLIITRYCFFIKPDKIFKLVLL